MKWSLVYAALMTAVGGAQAADLLDIYRQARSTDPTYASAKSAWSAAQERMPQARAGLLPLASVTASTGYNNRALQFREDALPRSTTNFGTNNATLSVTQPLFRKQSSIAVEQAATQLEQADAQLALAAQDLILRAAQSYFDVLLAQDNVALAEAQKNAIGQQLEQARRNFEVGTATISDTHEAQARYDLTLAQEIAARNELELRRNALEQVIGRAAPPLAPLGQRLALNPPQPASLDPWVSRAQRANLQVQVARSAATFADQEIARNRAAHLPTLDAFATVSGAGTGAGTTGGPGTDIRSSAIGVQLAIPLYQGGLVSSRVREAIANRSRASDELEAARRAAEFSARQGFLGITSGIAQVRALEAALVSTRSQLDSTRVGQEVGVRTQVDVLNAQQLQYSAQRDLAQSRYAYVLSLLRLEAAIGELTESDLAVINAWLDAPAPGSSASAPAAAAAPAAAPEPAQPVAGELPQPAVDGAERVARTIAEWARDWSANDTARFTAHYAPDFDPPKGLSRAAWEADRKARIAKPRVIAVEIEGLDVRLDGPERAIATFRQRYRSGSLHQATDKQMVLVRSDGRWLIRQEKILAESQLPAGR